MSSLLGKRNVKQILSFVIIAFSMMTVAETGFAKDACAPIVKACTKAGFVVSGGLDEKKELWADCALPIFEGRSSDAKLPPIKASVLKRCRAENPRFGQKG